METDPPQSSQTTGAERDTAVSSLPILPDVEALKSQNAVLERQTFNLTAELEDVRQNFIAVSNKNAEMKSEVDDINRQLEERCRLFRNLQLTLDEVQMKKIDAEQVASKLKQEREDKDLLLRKAVKEKQLVAVENQTLKEQVKSLSSQKAELEAERLRAQREQRELKAEAQRAIDEKEIFAESKKWYMTELTERDNRINQLRLEMAGKELSWQNERMRLTAEKAKAVSAVEDAEAEMATIRKQLEDANAKLATIVDEHEDAMSGLLAELKIKEGLIQMNKDLAEQAERNAEEMKSISDRADLLRQEMIEELETAKKELAETIEQYTAQLAAKDQEMEKMQEHVKAADQMMKDKHNLSLTDEALEDLAPAAAMASRLLKTCGGSLTAIYREHARLYSELEAERVKVQLSEQHLNDVLREVNDLAPEYNSRKEALEKAIDERDRLLAQLRDADKMRIELLEQRDWASRELTFTKGELEKYQRDTTRLVEQVSHLVFALEKERGQRSHTPGADSEDEDRQFFTDIRQLTKRNQQLESELQTERLRAEQKAQAVLNEHTQQLQNEVELLRKDSESAKEFMGRLETTLKKVEEQRDTYRRMVEEGGLDGEATVHRRQAEQANLQLKDAIARAERLEQWRAEERQEKERLVTVYEERIEQQMTVVSEVKRTNGRLESDLELQKQTAMNTLKELEKATREVERLREAEQKAREGAVVVETKLVETNAKMVEMHTALNALKVQNRSLTEELSMVRSNEVRLKAELNAIQQSHYQSEQMMLMMKEMDSRMGAMEANKNALLSSKLETTEAERDQLRSTSAAYAERIQKLENQQRTDLQRFESEKEELLTKLASEKQERVAMENTAQELRTKLIATQQHFSAVDSSIGANPERLAKECQQLKNQNKFLEGQMDELKKRAEKAEMASKKAMEELTKMSSLASNVESTLVEQSTAGAMEKKRLEEMVADMERRATAAETELSSVRVALSEGQAAQREAEIKFEHARLELVQKMAVMEMQLKNETERAAQLEEKARVLADSERAMTAKTAEWEERLRVLQIEATETAEQLQTAAAQLAEHREKMTAAELASAAEREGWASERSTMESRIVSLEKEIEGRNVEMEENRKKRDEQFEHIVQLTNELATRETSVGGGSEGNMSIDSAAGIAAVNRFLREEKQQAVERLMRAETEMKRIRVQKDELEVEKDRLEAELRERQRQAEADAVALAEKAQLVAQLQQMAQLEKENVTLKQERDKTAKTVAELNRKVLLTTQAKARQDSEMANVRGELTAMRSAVEEKNKEVEGLKKSLLDSEALVVKMRSELASAKKVAETATPPRGAAAMVERLKIENQKLLEQYKQLVERSEKEKADIQTKLDQVKVIARRYKEQSQAAVAGGSGSAPTSSESGDNLQTEASENAAIGTTSSGGWGTAPIAVATKKLQEEKEALQKKAAVLEEERDRITSERDELKFRLSSISSMHTNLQKKKQELAEENAMLKKRLEGTEGGGETRPLLEAKTEPESAGNTSAESLALSTRSAPAASASASQSGQLSASSASLPPPSTAPPPTPISTQQQQPVESSQSSSSQAVVSSHSLHSVVEDSGTVPVATSSPLKSGVSTPTQPAYSRPNPFGEGVVNWPTQLASTRAVPNSTTQISPHGPLFGRSAPVPASPADVSTSGTNELDEPMGGAVDEPSGEGEQPISSSSGMGGGSMGEGRKRTARAMEEEREERKRARVEDTAEDGISSSYRVDADLAGEMGEEDTRDAGDEDIVELDSDEDREAVVQRGRGRRDEEEEDDDDIEIVDDEEEEEGEDVEDDEDDDDNEEEDDDQEGDEGEERDEEGEESDDDEGMPPEDEGGEDERDGGYGGNGGRGGDGEDDNDVQVVGYDASQNQGGDEDVEEADRDSESEGEMNDDDELAMVDEDREAAASLEEADDEGRSPLAAPVEGGEDSMSSSSAAVPTVSQSADVVVGSGGTAGNKEKEKKRQPITWSADEEQCSSSNLETRPSMPRQTATRGRPREARPLDMATRLMRGGIGGGGAGPSGQGGQRQARGGRQSARRGRKLP